MVVRSLHQGPSRPIKVHQGPSRAITGGMSRSPVVVCTMAFICGDSESTRTIRGCRMPMLEVAMRMAAGNSAERNSSCCRTTPCTDAGNGLDSRRWRALARMPGTQGSAQMLPFRSRSRRLGSDHADETRYRWWFRRTAWRSGQQRPAPSAST